MNDFRERLKEMDKEVQELVDIRNRFIKFVQTNCPHPVNSIRQVDTDTPEWRICIDCGYAEETWGKGPQVLGKNIYGFPRVNRNDVWHLVLSEKGERLVKVN